MIGLNFSTQNLCSTETIFHIQYTKEFDTLNDITIRYFPIVKHRYYNQIKLYRNDLIRWNPQITNWKNLTSPRAIYIDSPDASETQFDALNRPLSFFIFYSAHYGSFTEKFNDQSITSSQTSPIALGLTSYYNIKERRHAIVSNISYAYLSGALISGTAPNSDMKIKIPAELGLSLYYQYSFNYSMPTLYTGFDRETFSSFNTSDLLNGDQLEVRKNILYFYALGLVKTVDVKKNAITLRASYAKSFKSSTTSADPKNVFKGSQIHFSLSLKGANNFSYNFLYKRFDLTGFTKLSVNRFGIGIGYQFY